MIIGGKSKQEVVRTVAEYSRGEIEYGDSDVWRNFEIPIPALPPSHFRYCEYITLSYMLKVKATLKYDVHNQI